jgi:hypothetical protein
MEVPFWTVVEGIKSVRRAWRTVVARPPEEPSMSVGMSVLCFSVCVSDKKNIPIMARRYFPLRVVFVRPMFGAFWVTDSVRLRVK